MTTQVKYAKQSLINKHKLYRQSNKTVANFFPFPQINQCVHIVSNCEVVNNENLALKQNNFENPLPNNIRMQTKITPIFTKNHGYPRLVQEFQFFINDAIIKYTNVTTSMPDRKDDAFVSQMSQFYCQNNINDYYFDLSRDPSKQEEGKIIEEEEKNRRVFNVENPNSSELHKTPQRSRFGNPSESSLFEGQQNKNHVYNFKQQCEGKQDAAETIIIDHDLREGSSLSGLSLSRPQIPNGISDQENGILPGSSDKENNWRGENDPDNKERKEVFKVIRKRICKYDKKISGCCVGSKTSCKVN